MIGKKMNSSRDIPLYEVRELLKERVEAGEPTYEQSLTYDYVKKFSKLTESKAEKLIAELKKSHAVSDELAIKIADLLPDNVERLKLLIPKEGSLDNAALEGIIKTVEKYRK